MVRRRRMVRNYSSEPVDPVVLDRILRHGLRAPSAGFSQGWGFLVLDDAADVREFWEVTAPGGLDDPDSWLRGMSRAPVVVVPLSHKDAYLDRYAEPDKGWTDRDEARWPVPYWHIDTAMASLLMLLSTVDQGLGACFFGIPPEALEPFKEAFEVPAPYTPIGAITIGHRTTDPGSAGSAARGHRPEEEVLRHGRWSRAWSVTTFDRS